MSLNFESSLQSQNLSITETHSYNGAIGSLNLESNLESQNPSDTETLSYNGPFDPFNPYLNKDVDDEEDQRTDDEESFDTVCEMVCANVYPWALAYRLEVAENIDASQAKSDATLSESMKLINSINPEAESDATLSESVKFIDSTDMKSSKTDQEETFNEAQKPASDAPDASDASDA